MQSLNYCNLIGTPHFALTDGQTWKIYSTFEQAPLTDRLISTFSIGETASAEVCLQALALWRGSVAEGEVGIGQAPIMMVVEEETPTTSIPAVTYPDHQLADGAKHLSAGNLTRDRQDVSEWVPLIDLSPQGGDTPPIEIQFPDDSRAALGRWNLVVVESTRWLYKNNCLNAGNWRVQRATRYVVSDAPIHPNGKEFTMASSIGSLFVEINYSAVNHVKNACLVIERAGQDPSQFKVRFSS